MGRQTLSWSVMGLVRPCCHSNSCNTELAKLYWVTRSGAVLDLVANYCNCFFGLSYRRQALQVHQCGVSSTVEDTPHWHSVPFSV